MPKHRKLLLKTFVHGISWDLFERYFGKLSPAAKPLSLDVLQRRRHGGIPE